MNLTYYLSALFVGAIFAFILAFKKHKKEQAKINEMLFKNNELIASLNKILDEIEKKEKPQL